MGRVYKSPPLVEALCEFHFVPRQAWDWTIPGLVYNRLGSAFPLKEHQNVLELQMQLDEEELKHSIKGGTARMRFLRQDKSAVVQVGPDLLAVNHLPPYPTWPKFKELVVSVLQEYANVASPEAVKRIGLRYVNRIEVPEHQVCIEDYLLAVPSVPEPIPQMFAPFMIRVEIPYSDELGTLILQSGLPPQPEKDARSLLLDLDLVHAPSAPLALDACGHWLERAHTVVQNAFEACLGPKARALFEEVT